MPYCFYPKIRVYYYQKGAREMRDYYKRIRCKGCLARLSVKNGTVRMVAKEKLRKELRHD